MGKIAFRQFLNSVTRSLPETVTALDIVIILLDLVLGLIMMRYHPYRPFLPDTWFMVGFHIVFLLLSLITPFQQELWKRRLYLFVCMSMIAGAVLLEFDFQLILYWWIVKSCFLLPRKEVIVMVVSFGVVYLAGYAWILEQIWGRIIALIAEKGVSTVLQLQVSWINQLIFFLGGSTFSIVLGFLVLSERQSRERTEALTQQVEALATALERTRIARDIHDSLGHSLTGLGIQLEAAQKLQHRDPEQAQRSLFLARQLADQCLHDVRRSLSSLRQSDFDLNHAIAVLVAQSQQAGFSIQLDFKLPQLPLQLSHQLYCIVQEGLVNVQKHADATQVILLGRSSADAIFIKLQDNGKGFDRTQQTGGFGIRGMKERSQILGGQFSIESVVGQGTQIQVIVPVQLTSEEHSRLGERCT
ncbi:sensor histidine kinase [Leptolyngbya sp. AN03gr2]|uniref:sensor histidine kinase n=1 Tax=unclassified Leptolyngbya TaxID=2650499 RepID=UPI003D322F9B